jgi:hypothetical protein
MNLAEEVDRTHQQKIAVGAARWFDASVWTDALSRVVQGVSVLFAFFAGSDIANIKHAEIFSLVSGGLGTVSLGLAGFSAYCRQASTDRRKEISAAAGPVAT